MDLCTFCEAVFFVQDRIDVVKVLQPNLKELLRSAEKCGCCALICGRAKALDVDLMTVWATNALSTLRLEAHIYTFKRKMPIRVELGLFKSPQTMKVSISRIFTSHEYVPSQRVGDRISLKRH
jgi:hypothetical protein